MQTVTTLPPYRMASSCIHQDPRSQAIEETPRWRKRRPVVRDAKKLESGTFAKLEQLSIAMILQCRTCADSSLESSPNSPNSVATPKKRKAPDLISTTNRAGRERVATEDGKVPPQVKSACSECRKRKQRCSGERPTCKFCHHRELSCSYEVADGLTKSEDLKQKLRDANCRADNLARVVAAMQSGTIEMSTTLLAMLRLGASVEDLLCSAAREDNPHSVAESENSKESEYLPSTEGNLEVRSPHFS